MIVEDVVQRVSYGIAKLFAEDKELFDLGNKGINEQTLTFRLGLYLAAQFPDHNVDCEYNRLWDGTKRCTRFRIKWMKPDVIVHIRRCDKANILCVEAKKAIYWKYIDNIPRDVRRKLRALTYPTAEYGYALGLAWRIAPSRDPRDHQANWFVGGEPRLKTSLRNFEEELIAALNELGVRESDHPVLAPTFGDRDQ
jgi:hypothetical protein